MTEVAEKVKEKKTTITISGEGDHTAVLDFAKNSGFGVKVWGKRGPTGPRKPKVAPTVVNTAE